MNCPNFLELLRFLDSATDALRFEQTYSHLSKNVVLNAFLQFCQNNRNGWVSDFEMDIKKCNEPRILFDNSLPAFDFAQIFFFLSAHHQSIFWQHFCRIIGRNPEAIQQFRSQQIASAIEQFRLDLESIQIEQTCEELMQMIQSNKDAIKTRILPEWNQALGSQENRIAFWTHVEKIFNLMNPYDQVIFETSKENDLVQSIFEKISSVGESGNIEQTVASFAPIISNAISNVQEGSIDLNKLAVNLMSMITKQ